MNTISLLVGGDCGPAHGPREGYPIEAYTELVRPTLAQADLRFVNCMRTYSTRPEFNAAAAQVAQPPEMAQLFSDCQFDAITMANNHTFDSGAQAMLDTRELLESRGMQVTGCGRDLDHAREPAILERSGIRVGYIGVTSVAHAPAEAGPGKPGVAPLRITATYEHRGPHGAVRVRTQPVQADLERLVADVRALKQVVDVAVVALHCGVIRLPRIISDYQVTAAHACIDAGADLIVGHSPHIPKAIEVYKGKAIFYSLGVFCMTRTGKGDPWNEPPWMHGVVGNHTDLDPDYPFMPYGRDCTKSLLAKAVVSKKGVERVSFLPMKIDKRYRPEPLKSADPRFGEIRDYLEWASQGFEHQFSVDGDEVVVS